MATLVDDRRASDKSDEKSLQAHAGNHEHALVEGKDEKVPSPAPDGGLQAWLQVLAAHLIVVNTWGFTNAFGIYQAYYTTAFQRSESDIAWVGSVNVFLLYFVGTFSGQAMDAGYVRHTIALGLFLVSLGVFMTSLATQYWHLVLAQGICQGIGNGLLFCPIIALISTWFDKRRTLAVSLQACGGATGGLIFPAIAQSLLSKLGFPWTMRIMGFVTLFNSVVILALLRERTDLPPRRRKASLFDVSAFKEPAYLFFTIGFFLSLWGVWIAYFYIRPYATRVLGVSSYTSFSLLLILNAMGIPGRLVPAFLANTYFGPLNTFIPTSLICGILFYAWYGVKSDSGIWVFVAFMGYFGGGVQSLSQAAVSTITTDMSKIGVRIGMVFSVVSFACLSGPPIAGHLIDSRGGNYLGAQVFGATVMVVGAGFLLASRTARVGWRLRARI